MRVWRVVLAGHQALDGEGTRRFGSRWVPKGLPAVYTSATLSLAALELFVHTDPDLAPADLLAISADNPDDLIVHELALSDLPGTWREIPAPAELQELGRSWAHAGFRTSFKEGKNARSALITYLHWLPTDDCNLSRSPYRTRRSSEYRS